MESYDLTGKLIIPFCTSGGSDIDETMPIFLDSCDGLAVYGERRIRGVDQIDGQQEIELENQGQKIYGIAYISETEKSVLIK